MPMHCDCDPINSLKYSKQAPEALKELHELFEVIVPLVKIPAPFYCMLSDSMVPLLCQNCQMSLTLDFMNT